ncbi:MHYT domain-containing protein [Antrihabitans cavernicola]|uniref:Signal protein n=1 Tax=Antrihabitans cavernicola TaxID=2495913 RepID=A0A5A7SHW1_9NOCA|nr:MHYT domain-containing protein [Spelaeibacter cavernicola]KAA0024307.1 signal protein [Spelaeibacter cavernicola]
MDHASMHHFDMGIWLLGLSFVVSVVGSIVGLACTRRSAVAVTDGERLAWLATAALSIGGVAIWLMHFIAMLGFTVPGSAVRYDIGWTIASAILSIVAVFIGLIIAGRTLNWLRLLAGGVVMGLAVNLMHYTGMRAVRIQGDIHYSTILVIASIAIAVVAATAALLFTLVLQSAIMRFVAGLVMGVAVVGMHFTGMAAVDVTLDSSRAVPAGSEVFDFLFPVFVIGLLALAGPIAAVMLAPDRKSAHLNAEADRLAAEAERATQALDRSPLKV